MLAIGESYPGSVYDLTRTGEDLLMMTDARDEVSAGDGRRKEVVPDIGIYRTAQNVEMMTYLRDSAVPVAFLNAVGNRSVMCRPTEMIPLEVVIRRGLMGSYLQRHPRLIPQWIDAPRVEFFHKRTLYISHGKTTLRDGNSLRRELGLEAFLRKVDDGTIVPDPYIAPGRRWKLYDAHQPLLNAQPVLEITPVLFPQQSRQVHDLALRIFNLLYDAFANVDFGVVDMPDTRFVRLADLKLEFGFTREGEIVLSDVVNLDNLRLLRHGDFGKENQISKQKFRDGGTHEEVLRVYRWGLQMVRQFNA